MYLAKNLRFLRLKNGFSQDYIAEILGYKSYTTIQKWETGISEPSISILSSLSSVYNVDMDTLYTIDIESGEQKSKKYNSIPLLGTIACGTPILAEQNIEDYFNIDTRVKADFALRIKGDSMIGAGISSGDIVFIKQQCTLENGEIGAILMGNSATLKKFYKDENTIILQAENDTFKPIVLTSGNVKILGKLVAALNIRE